jgi:hypothetical protein
MDKYSHVLIVVDRLEYYVTKEIERAMFNNDGEKSFKSYYTRIIECINADELIGKVESCYVIIYLYAEGLALLI